MNIAESLSLEEEKGLINKIVRSSDFSVLLKDTFPSMDINKKEEIYKEFPDLERIGVSKETLFEAIEDYHNIKLNHEKLTTLDYLIFDSIDYILDIQEPDGHWPVIPKKDFLISAPSQICKKSIDKKFPSADAKIARTWSNALLGLILAKADMIYKKEKEFTNRFHPRISDVIIKNNSWIKRQIKEFDKCSGTYTGLAHCPVDICETVACKEYSINDTSFAISTMIIFDKYSGKNGSLPTQMLLCDDYYNAKEGAWCIDEKKNTDDISIPDVGATSYAAIALYRYLNYWEMGTIDDNQKKFINDRIKRGLEWLLEYQNPDGSWGTNAENKDSRIDKTCFALQALIRNKYSHKRDIQVYDGFNFLSERLKERDDDDFSTKLFLWDNDDESDIEEEIISGRIKNTSLVISTLLKDNIPYNDYRIMHPLTSLLKLHNKKGYNLEKSFNVAYFYCALTDFLKHSKSHSIY